MTQLSADYQALANYRPRHKVRFVTAASLFDGHDAAINIMRRILQSMGAEVIHLGHNRSVDEVVTAALQEDVQGIAISSYQGGHVEYFKYMVDLLKARGYRWSDGNDGRPKSWWVELDEDALDDELHYLRTEIYRWPDADPPIRRLTAYDRFRA